MKIEIDVPDGVFDDISIVLEKFFQVKVAPEALKADRSDVIERIVKRDVQWWLADCFADDLADVLDEQDLEALGAKVGLNKKY